MRKARIGILFITLLAMLGLVACAKEDSSVNLELNKNKIEIFVDDTFKLELKADGIIITEDILWDSSEGKVASVNDGVVKGLSEGETIITGLYENESVSCEVKVLLKPNYRVSDAEVLLEVDGSKVVSLLNNGDKVTTGVTYKSINPEIASIENGKIMGVSAGETTIVLSYQNKSYQVKVTVINKFNPVGDFYCKVIVPEMDNEMFEFDLMLSSDNTYTYFRRKSSNHPEQMVSKGNYTYENGVVSLEYASGTIKFKVRDNDTIDSIGKIVTGGTEAKLTFTRVK